MENLAKQKRLKAKRKLVEFQKKLTEIRRKKTMTGLVASNFFKLWILGGS